MTTNLLHSVYLTDSYYYLWISWGWNKLKLKKNRKSESSWNIQSGILYLVGQLVDELSQVPKSTGNSPNLKTNNFSKIKERKFNVKPNGCWMVRGGWCNIDAFLLSQSDTQSLYTKCFIVQASWGTFFTSYFFLCFVFSRRNFTSENFHSHNCICFEGDI